MASLPQKTWVIDGTTYRTTVLSSVDGRGLYLRLVQAVMPALEILTDLQPAKKPAEGETPSPAYLTAKKHNEAVLAHTVARVLGSLDPVLFDDLCKAMCATTVCPRVNGEDSLQGEFGGLHFAGKYTRLMKCVLEFVKANGFLDFLSEISSLGLADMPIK